MTALIDADSIVWTVAYNFKDEPEFIADAVKEQCDGFVQSILTLTQATRYIGVFSSKVNFRHEIYLYQRYKGNRAPKPEFMVTWETIIKDHLTAKWGFYTSPTLEADDIVVAMAVHNPVDTTIICSPDKDLRQAPGYHYDYRTNTGIDTVTPAQACINLWTQVLTGDSTDNIAGVPGLGPKKVKDLFDAAALTEELNDLVLMQVALKQFLKYYGPYYGPIIYNQTLQSVMMVQPNHSRWELHKGEIALLNQTYVRNTPKWETAETECLPSTLGWELE
jgi:5'-3' exonuclease, N-terminal resolvase-like domain